MTVFSAVTVPAFWVRLPRIWMLDYWDAQRLKEFKVIHQGALHSLGGCWGYQIGPQEVFWIIWALLGYITVGWDLDFPLSIWCAEVEIHHDTERFEMKLHHPHLAVHVKCGLQPSAKHCKDTAGMGHFPRDWWSYPTSRQPLALDLQIRNCNIRANCLLLKSTEHAASIVTILVVKFRAFVVRGWWS